MKCNWSFPTEKIPGAFSTRFYPLKLQKPKKLVFLGLFQSCFLHFLSPEKYVLRRM